MINATVTGHLGQNLEQRFTGSGKSVVNLSICATPQRKDPQTGEYSDFGLPIWVEAPIWGYEADALLDAGVGKGWKVTVTGVLAHETYQARDGQNKQKTTLFNTLAWCNATQTATARRGTRPATAGARLQPATTTAGPQPTAGTTTSTTAAATTTTARATSRLAASSTTTLLNREDKTC